MKKNEPRYFLNTNGDSECLTLDEFIADCKPLPSLVSQVRALKPGDTVEHNGIEITRARLIRVTVTYEIDATDADDPETVIDMMLDNGDPQDSINDHEHDDAGPLKVRSAIVTASQELR